MLYNTGETEVTYFVDWKKIFYKALRMRRSYRRYFSFVCTLSFLNVLLFGFQIYQRQFTLDGGGQEQADYCDQSAIRKLYMRNQSPEELFVRDPVRPSFTYELSNKDLCSAADPPHALIFVISKSINSETRNAIRRTWGNLTHITSIENFARLRLKLLFLLDIDETALLSVKHEQSVHHDLVQVHLPQNYVLSTYRDMAILHWTETYCSNVSLTIKTDDDIFLNIFLLANALNRILSDVTLEPAAIIYGVRINEAQVVRHSNDPKSDESRYITTVEEYPCRYYPTYMSGFGYIITRHARVQLLRAFFRVEKLFHMSDVYVTGILPEYLNIPRRRLPFRINSRGADDCDAFFTENYAFACASPSHYKNQPASSRRSADAVEKFDFYWKRLYTHRSRSVNRIIKY